MEAISNGIGYDRAGNPGSGHPYPRQSNRGAQVKPSIITAAIAIIALCILTGCTVSVLPDYELMIDIHHRRR